ncbi:hypothetical protein D1B31_05260 [Neobacillus notoginsengisoli]|uniref:TNase-like domain-containing protein n=1 Tax=Neobacillus notoginsengisoli TaxID=1578198 RepID=A0A417YWV9_9BACI|nr:thermonuclease family protein [Neobacillus notoginsengisoli]RHW42051.1 hypothetical protein D1B31_05260 [Neobacillus notoginsengisoli]
MRNKRIQSLILLLLSLFLIAGCTVSKQSPETGKVPAALEPVNGRIPAEVIRNVDGDTVVIKLEGREETVRLLCVDTPETQHPRLGVQPFGPEASDFAKKVLHPGKKIEVEPGVNWGRDKYGRLLAYIYVEGEMFNEMLLEKGLARVAYVYPPNTKYVDQFYEIQDQAKKAEAGIWSIENYSTEDGFQSEAAQKPGAVKNGGGKQTACFGKIKGNPNSKIYHVPGGSYYHTKIKEIIWFCSEKEAEKAGYRKSKR